MILLSLIAADVAPEVPKLTGVLESVALGLLLGATGQGIRVIVGMKKLYDNAANNNQGIADVFDVRQFGISFVIGAVAGICAVFGLLATNSPFDVRSLLGLVAAGYAGADFIEGFASQWLPKNAQNQQTSSKQVKDGKPNGNDSPGPGSFKTVSSSDDPNALPSAEAPPNG